MCTYLYRFLIFIVVSSCYRDVILILKHLKLPSCGLLCAFTAHPCDDSTLTLELTSSIHSLDQDAKSFESLLAENVLTTLKDGHAKFARFG